ncbi:class I SAM-dependent methyltransferase [Patescibacteria group bacterium]|nr:class I SAM-dependent methyltransferase [Patescibacteria group bacterium]
MPDKEFDYTGIDISAKLVEIAKKEHPDATWKVANMTEFLQKVKNQETYDIIIAIASFHHLPSYRVRTTTANHMYRALAYE